MGRDWAGTEGAFNKYLLREGKKKWREGGKKEMKEEREEIRKEGNKIRERGKEEGFSPILEFSMG